MEVQTQQQKPNYPIIYHDYGYWKARKNYSNESKEELTAMLRLSYSFLVVIIAYWIVLLYGVDFNKQLFRIIFAMLGGLGTIVVIANLFLAHRSKTKAKNLRKEGLIVNINTLQQAIINDSVEAMEKNCHKIFGEYKSELGIDWNVSSADDVYHSLKANSDMYSSSPSFLMEIAHETIKARDIMNEYRKKKIEEKNKSDEAEQEKKREQLKKAAESGVNRAEIGPRTGSEEG